MSKNFARSLKRAAPIIFTGLSILGTIGTAILSARSAVKYKEITDDWKLEEPDKKEKMIITAKTFAPAALIGLATILSTTGASYLNAKNVASISAGYAMLTKGYKDFEKKARSVIGEDKYREIKRAIGIDSAKIKEYKKADMADSDNVTFYEAFRDEFFERDKSTVIEAEYAVNRLMATQGYVSLNEFYEQLDLPPIDLGDQIGWSYGLGADLYGYAWVDFEHYIFELEEGLEAIQILYPYPPDEHYKD